MKRMFKNLFLILLIGSVPLSMAFSQEKKNEKKVKVVIDDGSGTSTVLDTTFTGGSMPETITLKNGKVIFIGEPGKDVEFGTGKEKIVVTVTTDDEGEKNKEEKVIIISGDKGEWTLSPADKVKKHVYVYANKDGETKSHMTIKSDDEKEGTRKVEKTIVIKDGDIITKEGDEKFDVYIGYDEDADTDVTKYIIAKDGVVVTVESNDEAKAKELIKEIESRLGVKSEGAEKKEVVKTETKKK